MPRRTTIRFRVQSHPGQRLGSPVFRVVFWLFIAGAFAVSAALAVCPQWDPEPALGLLLLLGTAAVCMRLTERLPAQNVAAAAVMLALIGGGAHALGSGTGVPFGPYVYSQDISRPIFGVLPWPIPLIWALFVLSSRATARMLLRPWRRGRNYGFNLIGLTCGLTVLLDVGFEVFASRVFHWWKWVPTKLHLDVLETPVVNFAGWAVVSLLALAFVSPFLINKKPGSQPPADYHTPAVWLMLNLLFSAGAFARGFPLAATVVLALSSSVATLSVITTFWSRKARPEPHGG